MAKRELSEEEKRVTQRSIEGKEKAVQMWKLNVDVVENEMEFLPKKTELAMYAKAEELRKVKAQYEIELNTLETLKKQLEEGVEEKDDVEYTDIELKDNGE